MSLNTLKIKLQESLNESMESEDFKEALSDGIYACQFETSTALTDHIDIWLNFVPSDIDTQYKQGIQFVSDVWKEIKGEEL